MLFAILGKSYLGIIASLKIHIAYFKYLPYNKLYLLYFSYFYYLKE